MLRARIRQLSFAALAAATLSTPLAAQATSAAPPAQPAAAPPVSVSGLIFGGYNYQLSTTPAQLPSQNDNGFIIDRAYLNFRAPAGDRLSIFSASVLRALRNGFSSDHLDTTTRSAA